ncbi:VOC family protein [Gorillibacterium sp. sgz5001074]|uniref:VOC family protein n=1 Tax=Gorillibacterium sp. sgz5001074 TaxID=3446695 RepID=UPI003F66B8E2
MKFAGICLITKDVPALVRFYTDVLRAEADGDDTHADLHIDGSIFSIFSEQGMEGMAPGSMAGAGTGSFTISFRVQEVDAEYERLKALGVPFVKLPATHPWGARSFWFRDPDGNIVNFFHDGR